jgi:hypothetical protein
MLYCHYFLDDLTWRDYSVEAGSLLGGKEIPIFVSIWVYVTALGMLFHWILPCARWIQYAHLQYIFFFFRLILIVFSNQGLGFLRGISPSDVLLQFYQLMFTFSCYTCRQSCIRCWHFKASIPVIDVSSIYVRLLLLLRFETRTCILHFLKTLWIGWWWGWWGSFDDSF